MELVNGSILDFRGDAIVNPANSFLRHGGGLARVIDRAATLGTSSTQEVIEKYGLCTDAKAVQQYFIDHADAPLIATGNCHVTSPGVLPYKGIIHAVGPIWNGGSFHELDLLEMVAEEVFETVVDRGWRSVAVPAISCGVFGFPVETAARILTGVARWYDGDPLDITFYVLGDEHREAFAEAIRKPLFG